jgi:hypothetical protein
LVAAWCGREVDGALRAQVGSDGLADAALAPQHLEIRMARQQLLPNRQVGQVGGSQFKVADDAAGGNEQMEFVAKDRLLLRAAVPEGGPSQPASRPPAVALKWTSVTGMPATRPSGAARPMRLAIRSTARAAGASGHPSAITTASAISPHRAQAGSFRQPRDVATFAIGPIAFPAPAPPAPLTRLFATPV